MPSWFLRFGSSTPIFNNTLPLSSTPNIINTLSLPQSNHHPSSLLHSPIIMVSHIIPPVLQDQSPPFSISRGYRIMLFLTTFQQLAAHLASGYLLGEKRGRNQI